MASYSATIDTSAGSSTLPIISLYNSATVVGKITQVAAWNTTAISLGLRVMRITTAGTQGAGITAAKTDPDSPAAACTPFTTHSSTGPTLGDAIDGFYLGAAIGAGVILPAPPGGWRIGSVDAVTAVTDGIGLVPIATGQVCRCTIWWDE